MFEVLFSRKGRIGANEVAWVQITASHNALFRAPHGSTLPTAWFLRSHKHDTCRCHAGSACSHAFDRDSNQCAAVGTINWADGPTTVIEQPKTSLQSM